MLVRVIAGTFGGRRLVAPRGTATRPTSDRVREALFALLGDLAGTTVLDLFAGTGALGIEALSRGAAAATFVEHSDAALAALSANLTALALHEPRAMIWRGDARRFIRKARGAAPKYDLVLLDPPYRFAGTLGRELSVALSGLLAPGARVVSESDRRLPLELALSVLDERRYGDTLIRLYEPFEPHRDLPGLL